MTTYFFVAKSALKVQYYYFMAGQTSHIFGSFHFMTNDNEKGILP